MKDHVHMVVQVKHQTFKFILVNNQLDTQFFMYVYFYSLHVSDSHVPIIRRIIVSMRHLIYGIWHMLLHTRQSSTQSDINRMPH